MVLFNMPPGDFAAGDRGLACDPAKVGEFQANIGKTLDYAKALGATQIHCMAGLKPRGIGEDADLISGGRCEKQKVFGHCSDCRQ